MNKLRDRLHEIIFEAETPMGRFFDLALLWMILLSIIAVCLESVSSISKDYGDLLLKIEWLFTIFFTVEYFLRIFCVQKPLLYMRSFFGIVDLIAILPTYLSLYFAGAQSLLVIRAVRLLRVFRILKLVKHVGQAQILMQALRSSLPKITVFIGAVFSVALIMGSMMYLIEGEANGFTSIPKSMYWAIVTMTTVGYGDIAPQTVLGQSLASMVMILGYGIIAVPTGIVSAEIANVSRIRAADTCNTISCPHCGEEGHRETAKFCRECGGEL